MYILLHTESIYYMFQIFNSSRKKLVRSLLLLIKVKIIDKKNVLFQQNLNQ